MRSSAGFTLIELLIVMMILGLLAALVTPRLFKKVGKSRQQAARVQIEMLGTALDAYRLDVGRYPTTEEGLQALVTNPGNERWDGPYIKRIPQDPWGHPYQYRCPGERGEYDLWSWGRDGKEGGEGEDADIGSWE